MIPSAADGMPEPTGGELAAPGRDGALGAALERGIQGWVRLTGRAVRPEEAPWLAGPVGTARIGETFAERYAAEAGLTATASPDAGLLPDVGDLAGEEFVPAAVDPAIRALYERTGRYQLDAWAQWTGPLRPFAQTLIYLVSRTIEQLNLPLIPLATAHGMTSQVIRLVDPAGEVAFAGWLRRNAGTGAVIYAGFYTTCRPPNRSGPCVEVAFPLQPRPVEGRAKPALPRQARRGAGQPHPLPRAGTGTGRPLSGVPRPAGRTAHRLLPGDRDRDRHQPRAPPPARRHREGGTMNVQQGQRLPPGASGC